MVELYRRRASQVRPIQYESILPSIESRPFEFPATPMSLDHPDFNKSPHSSLDGHFNSLSRSDLERIHILSVMKLNSTRLSRRTGRSVSLPLSTVLSNHQIYRESRQEILYAEAVETELQRRREDEERRAMELDWFAEQIFGLAEAEDEYGDEYEYEACDDKEDGIEEDRVDQTEECDPYIDRRKEYEVKEHVTALITTHCFFYEKSEGVQCH